jgi:glucose/arabinose dehydrogenase
MHLICCSKFKKQEPRFMKALIPLFAGCILSFTSFHLSAGETFTESIDIQGKSIVFKVETLVSGLDHPWSLAELPNQGFLITERSGFYDKEVAKKLVEHLFSVRNAVDPAEAYRAFRGRDAKVDALMRDRGFPVN